MDGKRKFYLLGIVWAVFLLLSFCFYLKMMIPNAKGHIINNPYTMDSVWRNGDSNWHNDTLLYTILQNKPVHIHPDSWYFDYVSAFADKVIMDEDIEAQVKASQINIAEYTYLNHMLAIAHDTLFEEEVKEIIASDTEAGAADLYIAAESIADADEIMVFHDEAGNLYVKGFLKE